MILAEAKEFVIGRALLPALDRSNISAKTKNVHRSTIVWINKFERIGDLVDYMDRFKQQGAPHEFSELAAAGIPTFEELRDEFLDRFGDYQDDRTRLGDFVIGNSYDSYQLSIFARTYDTRGGGILKIGSWESPRAIFVKATLDGSNYPNEWISPPDVLKFYLKSRRNEFKEDYVENAAIINNPDVPIYAFVREKESGPFVLEGIFRNEGVREEDGGAKWFELHRWLIGDVEAPVDEQKARDEFERRVREAQQDPPDKRKTRLDQAPKKPKKQAATSYVFVRNPDVVAEVLARANGICEGCDDDAPFLRAKDGSPYLEVHHRVPLAENGDDTVENALALCPNCHREAHFGQKK